MKKKFLFLSAIFILVVSTNKNLHYNFARIEAELVDFPYQQLEYSLQSSGAIIALPDNRKISCLLGEKINFFYKGKPFLEGLCSEKIFLAEFEPDKVLEAFKKLEGDQSNHNIESREIFQMAITMGLKSGSSHLCWENISAKLALEKSGEITVAAISNIIGHGRDINNPSNCEHYNIECKNFKIRKALIKKNNHYINNMARTVIISNEVPYACMIKNNHQIHGYKIIDPDNLCHYEENRIFTDKTYELIEGIIYDVSIDIVSKGYIVNLYERHYEVEPINLSLITSLPKSTIALKNKNYSCLYQMKVDI